MSQPLASLTTTFSRSTGPLREVLILLLSLLAGALLLPLLIWLAGRVSLGAYANGGPLALWLDFMRGLARGESAFWIVLIGPYAATWILRFFSLLLRR